MHDRPMNFHVVVWFSLFMPINRDSFRPLQSSKFFHETDFVFFAIKFEKMVAFMFEGNRVWSHHYSQAVSFTNAS